MCAPDTAVVLARESEGLWRRLPGHISEAVRTRNLPLDTARLRCEMRRGQQGDRWNGVDNGAATTIYTNWDE